MIETVPEKFMAYIADKPRFQEASKSGRAFTVGSAKPDKLSPEQAEILAAVLAQHPALTRDEALEHLREAGL